MFNTSIYIYHQYNQYVRSKKIRFGSYYLIIRVEIDTTMTVVKWGHIMLEMVFDLLWTGILTK